MTDIFFCDFCAETAAPSPVAVRNPTPTLAVAAVSNNNTRSPVAASAAATATETSAGQTPGMLFNDLDPGDSVFFVVGVEFDAASSVSIGSVFLRQEDYGRICTLHQVFVDNKSSVAQAPRPRVGSLAAVLSPQHDLWFRAQLLQQAGTNGPYKVLYIDYGNVEEGVVQVEAMPRAMALPSSLAVKVTLMDAGKIDYGAKQMQLESCHMLKVVERNGDSSLTAELKDENDTQTICRVTVQPWTCLLVENAGQRVPCRKWQSGSSSEVLILSAADLDSIYVQPLLTEAAGVLGKIEETLMQACPASAPLSADQLVVGQDVASLFPDDGQFYRARITSISNDKTSAEVFYVDYGNSCSVQLSDAIRPLPDSLFQYEAVCHRVVLSGLDPSPNVPCAVADKLLEYTNVTCNMKVVSAGGDEAGVIECILTAGGVNFNDEIGQLLQTAQSTIPVVPADAVATAHALDLPELVPAEPVEPQPIEYTLATSTYDDGPFQDLPDGQFFEARILNSADWPMIHFSINDESLMTKLQQMQVMDSFFF